MKRLYGVFWGGWCLAWAGLVGASSAEQPARPQYSFVIEGLAGEENAALLQNVNGYLSQVPNTVQLPPTSFRLRADMVIRESLQALGYYRPDLTFRWENLKPNAGGTLHVQVRPGEPVRIEDTIILIKGEGKDDKAFQRLLKRVPKKGRVLHHARYEDFKNRLIETGQKKGYFDARLVRHRLAVDAEKGIAYWWIVYDSGPRYKMSDVRFAGSQIRRPILQNLVPFQKDSYYHVNKVTRLNRRMTETGWFQSVVVVPQFEQAKRDHHLPFDVTVIPRKGNTVEFGLGVSTDNGPRGKLLWKKPWWDETGKSVSADISLSANEQNINSTLTIPLREQALEQYWQIQGGIKSEDLNDTRSTSTSLLVSRHWTLDSGWLRDVHMRMSYDDFTQAGISEQTMLWYPGITYTRTRSRGGAMPKWGDSQTYSLDWSDDILGSDVSFLLLKASATFLRQYDVKHRVIARAQAGYLHTDQFEQVPPDLRFFAGGDRSIRGFGYKDISPKNSQGELTGGSHLWTASLEYQYRVLPQWWAAAFVDAGDASHSWSLGEPNVGAGIGIRWASPVGPIKLDIAKPIKSFQGQKDWQFYFGIGPEL